MAKLKILYLCTGNSCRSQMAEALTNHLLGDLVEAHSAGSKPDPAKFPSSRGVHPRAVATLQKAGIATENLYSKSWDPFIEQKDSIDFVFTLCGSALKDMAEACPVFPGMPRQAHWGLDDPSHVQGSEDEIRRAFDEAFGILKRRISLFGELVSRNPEPSAIQKEIERIGKA